MHSSFSVYIKDKWSHSGFQKYFQNAGWLFFGRLGSMAISFVATAYIARHLGPTNYGELSYALSFVSVFSFLAVLGIDQVLYRELITHPHRKNEFMGTAFCIRIAASLIAIFLCILFAALLSPKDVSFFLILLLSMGFFFGSFQVFSFEFQADVNSKFPSLIALYVSLILNILKIIVIVMDQGVIYLAIVYLLESILYAIGFIYYRKKIYGSFSNLSFDFKVAKDILNDSWPLIFASAFSLVYARIDQIMLKNMIDAQSVGLYDSAVRLSEVWYFIPTIISSALFPAIINSKKTSEHLYHNRLIKLALASAGISVIIALCTLFLAPLVIKIVFGPTFIGAALTLQIYIWSNVPSSLNAVANLYFVAENFKKTLFISTFIGMLTNIVLNIYLIPMYGIAGAALATLISYTIPFFLIFLLPHTRKIFS